MASIGSVIRIFCLSLMFGFFFELAEQQARKEIIEEAVMKQRLVEEKAQLYKEMKSVLLFYKDKISDIDSRISYIDLMGID